MRILSHSLGPLAANLVLLVDESAGTAAVVDPGFDSQPVLRFIEERGWAVARLLNTHGHFDHIAGNAAFQRATGAPIALHRDDLDLYRAAALHAGFFGLECPPQPDPADWLEEGQIVELAGRRWEVLHTPGHSPGHVCLHTAGHLLAGDLLFAGSVGRVDLPGGSWPAMAASLRRVLALADDTVVYPGHGPQTTIGEERARNPFVAMALGER